MWHKRGVSSEQHLDLGPRSGPVCAGQVNADTEDQNISAAAAAATLRQHWASDEGDWKLG